MGQTIGTPPVRLLARVRARTAGFTVSPAQYAIVAYAALGALTLIVLTGAAVRLTGSGLGCPTWPKCYGNVYPPLNTHAVIEFSNRLITAPVSIAAGLAWLGALRRRPYRRDLAWLGGLLPLGVIGQAVLGGFTVRGELDYGWVMGHFALSMLILAAAVLLAWRATPPSLERELDETLASEARIPQDGPGARGAENGTLGADSYDSYGSYGGTGNGGTPLALGDRALVWSVRGLLGLGAITIFAGTAATAAGPHAGGSPGQRINRMAFEGRATMDFVIHRHGEIAFAFCLAAVAVWWLARRRPGGRRVVRPLTALCVLLALQGIVGLEQYETHLPTELVWLHVALATFTWLATLWAACAAGPTPEIGAATGREPADERVAVLPSG